MFSPNIYAFLLILSVPAYCANIYAYRGRQLLSKYQDQHQDAPGNSLSRFKQFLRNKEPSDESPVAVIGAGTAGLYTAMIFESLDIKYQIIDADTPQRVGGRLYTHHFANGGPYDYFDIGAMRFPDTPFMKRVFDLAQNRSLPLKLIPFIMQMVEPNANTFLFYNNARVNNRDTSITGDPFNVASYVNDTTLTTPAEVSQKVAAVIQPFRDLFRPDSSGKQPDIAAGMETLFELTNQYSMRTYMFEVLGMDAKDIHWCETLDKSTGWYDRALTETIIESLAFDWPTAPLPGPEPSSDPNASWHCFDGGSSTLPQAMFKSLSQSSQDATLFRSPVTAISEDTQTKEMYLSINGTRSPQSYSAVISTVPLPRLSLMDLTGVNINSNYGQWSAIRELQYGPSIKVGIKFNTPWWETQLSEPIHGGQSYTDQPVRTIVYPSYPAGASPQNMSSTLIATYCWTQDAERMGALINGDGTGKPELMDLIFRDLAAVHGVTVEWLMQFYTPGNYYAWDWLHNPLTMGAFAFFGPGVYGNGDIYNLILQPAANGKLFFAGEAASTAHAWVAGALDSAWRAVDQYLSLNQPKTVQEKFWDMWGATEYWDEGSDKELIKLNRDLADRHLEIALHNSGVKLES